MNYITKWHEDLLQRVSLNLAREVRVEGVRKQHVGPRLEYARIDVLAEPSEAFDVHFAPELDKSGTTHMFLESAVLGLLDILMVAEPYPLRNVKLTITHCDIDPVASSQMAFRQAGRDAGTMIMNSLKRATST